MFQGDREGGGLRDFTRALLAALNQKFKVPENIPEAQELLSAYVRVILTLGAQSGFDPFLKACQMWRSNAALKKSIAELQGKTQKQLEELKAPKKKAKGKNSDKEEAPEVLEYRKGLIVNRIQDCEQANLCLLAFEAQQWFPFAELKELHSRFGNAWFKQLVSQAISHVSSYRELCLLAETEHLVRKLTMAAWANKSVDHRRYLEVRPRFVLAEQEGKIRGHRGRIVGRNLPTKYLEWLRENPSLVSWRGSPAELVEFDSEAKENIASARKDKKAAVAIAEFLRLNPELAELDRLHGEYDKQFARRVKGKLLPDTLKILPTYTEPEAVFHARGIMFTAPQSASSSWSELSVQSTEKSKLPAVTLRLPNEAGCGNEHLKVYFHPDKRFKRLFGFKSEKGGLSALYRDPRSGILREVLFKGIRLRFEDVRLGTDKEIEHGKVFLDFAISISGKNQKPVAKEAKWKDPRKKDLVQLPRLDLAPGTRVGLVEYSLDGIAWVSVGTWNGSELERHGKTTFRTRFIKPSRTACC